MRDKRICAALLMLAIIINASMICLIICNYLRPTRTSYTISAYYFADECPRNFWNAEWDMIDQDFSRIKRDGFNTIIVVIPWREFQPEMTPIQYNDLAWDRLPVLFKKAQNYGLDVQIRVGYLYDFMAMDDPAERFYKLIWDDGVRTAWSIYMDKLYTVCSAFDNFAGGFIAQEDFRHLYAMGNYLGAEERLNYARYSSFGEFLSGKYSLDEFNAKYNLNLADLKDIYIPTQNDEFLGEWYEHVDIILMNMLERTRKFFPDLFMEVQTYADPVFEEGEYSPDAIWNCRDGKMTGIMYSMSQGLEGGQQTAETVVQNMERWLQRIYSGNGQIPIYIDRFQLYDNVLGDKAEEQVMVMNEQDYLAKCVPVLKEYTNGYGVWTYRDYCDNLLYNPQFFLGLEGWQYDEHCVIWDDSSSSKRVWLSNGKIDQYISAWRKSDATETDYIFTMDYDAEQDATFTIKVGDQCWGEAVNGQGKLKFPFTVESGDISISIRCNGQAYVDNIKLYNSVSVQPLYGMDNSEKQCIEKIRVMNKLLIR